MLKVLYETAKRLVSGLCGAAVREVRYMSGKLCGVSIVKSGVFWFIVHRLYRVIAILD